MKPLFSYWGGCTPWGTDCWRAIYRRGKVYQQLLCMPRRGWKGCRADCWLPDWFNA